MQQPAQPPQQIGKQKMPLQFPKVLWRPLLRPLSRWMVALQERGAFGGRPLTRHIVVCGFPRSGSTLLQLMIEACVSNVQTFGRECYGLETAKTVLVNQPYLMTKRPSDIFLIDRMIRYYTDRPAEVRFILTLRDPRAVLTSVHNKRPGHYYVSPARWRAIYEHWKWASELDCTLTVRYEDLVSQPARIQSQLSQFIGWTVLRPFEQYQQAVPERFDTRALNGLRALEPRRINRWRATQHRERLLRLTEVELPELADVLVQLGYESDRRWLDDLANDQLRLADAA